VSQLPYNLSYRPLRGILANNKSFDIKIRHSENAGTRDTVTYGNIRVTLEKPDLDFGKTYKASTANLWASLKATTTDNGRTWTIEKVVIPPMKT